MRIILQRLRNIPLVYQAYFVGVFFFVIYMITLFVFPSFVLGRYSFILISAFFFVIGFFMWCWPAVKKIWLHPVGSTFIVVLHLFALLLSAILARNVVAAALGLPPQDFDVSVSFMALLLYVPAWSVVVSVPIGFFALILYLIALLSGVSNGADKNVAKFFGHTVGACIVFSCSLSFFDLVIKNEKFLHPLVRRIAFYGDFQQTDAYPGIGHGERIRLHENGVISLATIEDNTVVIRVRKYE